MGVPHDTLFIYRFDAPADRIYGPRALQWVVATYGKRPECECAPADTTGMLAVGPWQRVAEWAREMLPEPATKRQRTRLTNLKVTHDPAAITRDEAARLIREAEGGLAPTKGQLADAAALGIDVPPGATRAEVEALVDAAERSASVEAVRREKVEIDDDASWQEIAEAQEQVEERKESRPLAAALRRRGVAVTDDLTLDDLYELDSARRDLDEAIREARSIGFKFESPAGLTYDAMQQLYASLNDLGEQLALMEVDFERLAENGLIPRKPRRTAIKAALPELFERIQAREWQGSESDVLWFCRRALELDAARPSRPRRAPSGEAGEGFWPAALNTPAEHPATRGWPQLLAEASATAAPSQIPTPDQPVAEKPAETRSATGLLTRIKRLFGSTD
jgi:hypothetical protein